MTTRRILWAPSSGELYRKLVAAQRERFVLVPESDRETVLPGGQRFICVTVARSHLARLLLMASQMSRRAPTARSRHHAHE